MKIGVLFLFFLAIPVYSLDQIVEENARLKISIDGKMTLVNFCHYRALHGKDRDLYALATPENTTIFVTKKNNEICAVCPLPDEVRNEITAMESIEILSENLVLFHYHSSPNLAVFVVFDVQAQKILDSFFCSLFYFDEPSKSFITLDHMRDSFHQKDVYVVFLNHRQVGSFDGGNRPKLVGFDPRKGVIFFKDGDSGKPFQVSYEAAGAGNNPGSF